MTDDRPEPRLCVLRRKSKLEKWGMQLIPIDDECLRVGHVEVGSIAQKAFLMEGDIVMMVNGNETEGLTPDWIVSRIQDDPLQCELLVLSESELEWYKKRGISVNKNVPNLLKVVIDSNYVQTVEKIAAAGPVERLGTHDSFDEDYEGIKATCINSDDEDDEQMPKSTEPEAKDDGSGTSSFSSGMCSTQPLASSGDCPQPRLCIMRRKSVLEKWGMQLIPIDDECLRVGHVEVGSIAQKAFLMEGDIVMMVNGNETEGLTPDWIVSRIQDDPLQCELLVLSESELEWYKKRGISVNKNVPNLLKVVIDSNYVQTVEKIAAAGPVERLGTHDSFDEDYEGIKATCINSDDEDYQLPEQQNHSDSINNTTDEEQFAAGNIIYYTKRKLIRGQELGFKVGRNGVFAVAVTMKNPAPMSPEQLQEFLDIDYKPKRALIRGKINDVILAKFEEDSFIRYYVKDTSGETLVCEERAKGIAYNFLVFAESVDSVFLSDSNLLLHGTTADDSPRIRRSKSIHKLNNTHKPEVAPKPRVVSMIETPNQSLLESVLYIADAPPSDVPEEPFVAPGSELNHEGQINEKTPPKDPYESLDVFYTSTLRYIKHIGNGAQGAVALVSTEFYPEVAVKYFNEIMRAQGRAMTELHNTLKLNSHPNIVQLRGILYESEKDRQNLKPPIGILLEYMKNGNLFQVIHHQTFNYNYSNVLEWIRQASSALSYLHQRHLVHRDVKPENLLLADDFRTLKLADLGISTTIKLKMTVDIGTQRYVAPEMMPTKYSDSCSYNEKVDVYALAITIWELLHKQIPFKNESTIDLINKVPTGLRPKIEAKMAGTFFSQILPKLWENDSTVRMPMIDFHSKIKDEIKKYGPQ